MSTHGATVSFRRSAGMTCFLHSALPVGRYRLFASYSKGLSGTPVGRETTLKRAF